MNLSAPFIYRPVMTTLAMIALLVAGLMAYSKLPISSMPDITYPTISVKTTLPGALPETMANSVALPLEKQFMAIPGLRLVSSNNTLGISNIVLQFEIDKNMTTAAQDVQEAITNATPFLPPNLPFGPTYRKVNPSEQPIIYLSLTSDTMRTSDLYTYGNTLIGQRISMIEGVSQVTTYGSVLAVRVQVDPAELAARDVTLNEVAEAIRAENPLISTGQLDGPVYAPLISVDGQLTTGSAYEPVIVAYREGTPVRIRDLGRVVESFENNKMFTQFTDAKGTRPSVTLAIQKEPGANTVAIADAIYNLLDKLKHELPPAVDLHIVFDRSIPVRAAIEDTIQTLVLALILVVLVIFFFLGKITDTIIPTLVLPLSVIATFIVMHLLHFNLDNLSVLALTLAVGFIIDDAVVVLENIVRQVELGKSPLEASLIGSRQISFTIVSMSLSLIAVFIPMLFMGGLLGKIFSEFAITLTVITVISGLISLSLTPMLSSRFIPPRNNGSKKHLFSQWSDKINRAMHRTYHRLLIAVLHHRLIAVLIAISCTAATLWLLVYLPVDFVPDEDLGFFTIFTQKREGSSSFSTLDNENKLIDIVRSNAAVEKFVTISSFNEYRKGLSFVTLKPIEKRPPIQQVVDEVYRSLGKLIGFQSSIKKVPLIDLATGQTSRSAYQFAMQSIFSEKLYPSARKLVEKMRQDPMFEGIVSDFEIDTPQINVNILRDQTSRLGITASDIESSFALGYSGNLVSRIQTPIDQYYVILELYPEYQQQTNTFNHIWLRSTSSEKLVPLSSTIEWKEGIGASSINHINQFPSVTISFNLTPGVPLESALNRLQEYTQQVVESGVTARPIGAAQTFKESIKSSGYLLILTIVCIYIILGILYESFIHPVTILTTLPPATFGGLLTLLVLGLPLSMYSFLGLILLIGIVKKNGIMMVDFALENIRTKGMTPQDAIVDASLARFRPIMMTTAAAIFSVLPITIGYGANAAARKPLGYVVTGGLLLSQLVTLFITPILYLAMEKISHKFTPKDG